MPARPPLAPRQATAADIPAVHDVIAAAYGKYLSRMDKPPGPMLRDYGPVAAAGQLWVSGEPVSGVVSLIESDDGLLIENIAIDPSAQGTGLGRALMEFAERRAAERMISRLWLYTHEVMTENYAIYTHLGYREYERRAENGYRRIYMEKLLPA
jgi:ribosomal protein S18 acetylase RimI-like enzyme